MAVAMYPLPHEKVRALVPAELEPGEFPLCLTVFARYPESTVGPYHEVVILVAARAGEEEGFFCPFIYVTTDAALAAGREVWGFPKKLAEIEVLREGESLAASVRRKGARISLEATFTGPAEEALVDALGNSPIFNEKVIPAVTGKEPEIRQVTATVLEMRVREARVGIGRLVAEGGPEDAWGLLATADEVTAFWIVSDTVLPPGRVVRSS